MRVHALVRHFMRSLCVADLVHSSIVAISLVNVAVRSYYFAVSLTSKYKPHYRRQNRQTSYAAD